MSQTNDAAAKKAADEKAKADAAKKAADDKAKEDEAKKVRVIKENGTLGPLLLSKGDTTDDKEYVALLKTKRGRTLVEAVK